MRSNTSLKDEDTPIPSTLIFSTPSVPCVLVVAAELAKLTSFPDLLLSFFLQDVRIMDIIHLIHARLTSQRDRFRWTPDEPLFAEVLEISDMRMRKCFKLSA